VSFTQQLWREAEGIYRAIITHPYNMEIAQGTLAAERFRYYVQQDSLYLRDYMRALTLLAAKAEDGEEAHELLTWARDAIQVERDLHQMMSETLNIPPVDEQEPACFAYTNFLLARTALDPYPVGLAAVLPCFWIYREVGNHIAGCTVENNPYAPWISTYSDPGFAKVTDRIIEITDRAAQRSSPEIQREMIRAFVQSSQCEWDFWNAAYREIRWTTRG